MRTSALLPLLLLAACEPWIPFSERPGESGDQNSVFPEDPDRPNDSGSEIDTEDTERPADETGSPGVEQTIKAMYMTAWVAYAPTQIHEYQAASGNGPFKTQAYFGLLDQDLELLCQFWVAFPGNNGSVAWGPSGDRFWTWQIDWHTAQESTFDAECGPVLDDLEWDMVRPMLGSGTWNLSLNETIGDASQQAYLDRAGDDEDLLDEYAFASVGVGLRYEGQSGAMEQKDFGCARASTATFRPDDGSGTLPLVIETPGENSVGGTWRTREALMSGIASQPSLLYIEAGAPIDIGFINQFRP